MRMYTALEAWITFLSGLFVKVSTIPRWHWQRLRRRKRADRAWHYPHEQAAFELEYARRYEKQPVN